MKEITIKEIKKPAEKDVWKDVFWLCESTGLTKGRDTKKLSSALACHLLKKISEKGSATSEELADDLGTSVANINHHIRNFMETGLIYREKRRLYLRGGSVKAALEEIRKDTEQIFNEMGQIATDIDKTLRLKAR